MFYSLFRKICTIKPFTGSVFEREVSQDKKKYFVTLPYRCNSYVSQVTFGLHRNYIYKEVSQKQNFFVLWHFLLLDTAYTLKKYGNKTTLNWTHALISDGSSLPQKIHQLNLNHCVFVATFMVLALPEVLSTTYFNLKEKSAFLSVKKIMIGF